MNRRPLVRRARRRLFPLQFEAMESRLLLATFLVDNTNDSGSGSLRQAIDSANATAGFNIIDFDINSTGMPVIAPASPLPEITNPVLIYGISQPGSHLVEISGAGAGPGVDGLWISAGNSGVAGLAIVKFGGSGIRLTTHGGNIIVADQIGTDPSGASGLGNMGDAVTIVGAPGNTIDGTILSNSGGSGISISGAGATGNVVEGNYIGTNAAGTLLPNAGNGVEISGSSYNTIGGTTPGARNLISDNLGDGVLITSFSKYNLVQGNYIGTNAAGTNLGTNAGNGVEISGSSYNTIGGAAPAPATSFRATPATASGSPSSRPTTWWRATTSAPTPPALGALINAGDGVEISFSTQNTIGGTTPGARNLISGNYGDGVGITDFSTDNLVEGNYIGTDYLGTEALGNIQGGISIGDAATNNTVGGITPGARNLISGNYGDGVSIIGTAVGPNTTDNLVLGNYIGTDNNGTEALGNNGNGVSITAAPGNSKGLSTPVAFNLISGNGQNGIAISNVQRPSNGGPFGSLVVGNFIGTDVFGSLPLGNGGDGILLDTAASNTIGGTTPAFRNILSGNSAAGIEIRGGDSISNLVEGNYIGTDKNGKAALANLVGVFINGSPGNTIGGTNASAQPDLRQQPPRRQRGRRADRWSGEPDRGEFHRDRPVRRLPAGERHRGFHQRCGVQHDRRDRPGRRQCDRGLHDVRSITFNPGRGRGRHRQRRRVGQPRRGQPHRHRRNW